LIQEDRKMNESLELKNRLFHGIWLASISVYCAVKGGWYFNALLSTVGLLSASEWMALSATQELQKFKTLGLVLIFSFCFGMVSLPKTSLLPLFAIVWSTDCGAYFFGKYIGGPKLCPALSPNKTLIGLIGGVFCGYVGGCTLGASSLQCFMVSCASQCGDLLESYAKRLAKVKDSNLPGLEIPGHGGILDRIDALIIATPVAYLVGL
jgi:CDP-diglyceride synthetase